MLDYCNLKEIKQIKQLGKSIVVVVDVQNESKVDYDTIYSILAQHGIDDTYDIKILTKFILSQDIPGLEDEQFIIKNGDLLYEQQ